MNKFAILSVFLVAFACANAGTVSKKESSSSSSEELKELASLLENKFNITILNDVQKLAEKAKEKCPNIEEKIDNVAESVQQCIEEIELGSETFCSLIKKNFAKCAKPATDLVSSCLPEESKDLPALTIKTIVAVIEQACASTVEEILELLNPCVLEADLSTIPACGEIKNVLAEHKNKLPSKELICSTLPKVRNCAKDFRQASCKNAITNRVAANFQNAIENALKDDCASLNKV